MRPGDRDDAAPVLDNTTSTTVNGPAGKWYDVMNKCVVSGQTDLHSYKVRLASVPMFVKRGTPQTAMLMKAPRRR